MYRRDLPTAGNARHPHVTPHVAQYGQNPLSTDSNDSIQSQVPRSFYENEYQQTQEAQQNNQLYHLELVPGSQPYTPQNYGGQEERYGQGYGYGQRQGLGLSQAEMSSWEHSQMGNRQTGMSRHSAGNNTSHYGSNNVASGGPVGGFGRQQPQSHQNPGNFYPHGGRYEPAQVTGYGHTGYGQASPYNPYQPYQVPSNGNRNYSRVQPSNQHRGPQRAASGGNQRTLMPPQISHQMGKKRSVSDLGRAGRPALNFGRNDRDVQARFGPPQAKPPPSWNPSYSQQGFVTREKYTPPHAAYDDSQSSGFGTPTLGGPVRQPASVARTGSPTKSVHRSSRSSSVAPGSRASEVEFSTPGPSKRQTDLVPQSEPPNRDTWIGDSSPPKGLRRSKKSVYGLGHNRSDSTGSLRLEATNFDPATFFAELTPLAKSGRPRVEGSPPKMGSLTPAGEVDELSPINEGSGALSLRPGDRKSQTSHYTPVFNGFSAPVALKPYQPDEHNPQKYASPELLELTSNLTRKPSYATARSQKFLPFVEYSRSCGPDHWGVILIKNIPYNVARAEVMAFLGRNARIIDERQHEPVHIVMERTTSKTLDCYVEFINLSEAVSAVNRFEVNRTGGRGGRLGQRHVEVELSSQEALMKELFPKATNVKWAGVDGRPEIIPADPTDEWNTGFKGFVSKEEIVMLVKHVEAPQRSPFSKDCPQRPFECLISTLLKYPWFMVDYITIEDRNLLHGAAIDLLRMLADRVFNTKDDVNLTTMLYKRVWRAAIRCPGFTPCQKDDVVYLCGVKLQEAEELGHVPYAAYWTALWTIGPKPGVPDDVLLWYCAIIREATESRDEPLSLAERSARGQDKVSEPGLLGNLGQYIQYGTPLLYQTLAAVALAEWEAIEKILEQALAPAIEE